MPPVPHSSVPHGKCRWVGYTKVWNLLDYTALVIPGGEVEAVDLDAYWGHGARSAVDEELQAVWMDCKVEMASLKLPVGLQLIGRKLEEEKVLGAAKIVDEVVRRMRRLQ